MSGEVRRNEQVYTEDITKQGNIFLSVKKEANRAYVIHLAIKLEVRIVFIITYQGIEVRKVFFSGGEGEEENVLACLRLFIGGNGDIVGETIQAVDSYQIQSRNW